ncbi:MAG: hypothetical protein C5B48_08375 [Candidatus Rokuibacteriota bacterium]|nr:MAG: hypothetical protein C5B48_08375 [Candidatus Rokubacteria bacterium]
MPQPISEAQARELASFASADFVVPVERAAAPAPARPSTPPPRQPRSAFQGDPRVNHTPNRGKLTPPPHADGEVPAWARTSIDPELNAARSLVVPLRVRQADEAAARNETRRKPTTFEEMAGGMSGEQLAALTEAATAERRKRWAAEQMQMSPEDRARVQAENEALIDNMDEEPHAEYVDPDDATLQEFGYSDDITYAGSAEWLGSDSAGEQPS